MGLAVSLKGETIGITGFVPAKSMTVVRKMLGGLLKDFSD
jgi:hypothetical protein